MGNGILVTTICDFQISPFCKKEYNIFEYKLNYNKKSNNYKYRCKFCAIQQTHLGEKSHYYKIKVNEDFFSIIDSEIKAYLLGVIAGDGCVQEKIVSIVANNKDVQTLELFKSFVAPTANLTKHGNCFQVAVTSRKMCNDIRGILQIPIGKKSDKITLPKLDDELMRHFIRGLMDTDGCIANPFLLKAKSPRCFYSSTSVQILLQVQDFFKLKNIESSICGIKLDFRGKNAVDFLNAIYINSIYSLDRKRNFYEIWKTWIPYKGTSVKSRKFFKPHTSKFNDLEIKEIRNQYNNENMSIKDIVKKYNVSREIIKNIVNNTTYRDVV